jgi:hypothetical protein
MARAYGSSAHLLMKRETAYGQSATGNYIRMPFNRCSLDSEQGLIDDPVLGQGRDPLAPLQDVIADEGDIVVPVDPRYLGLARLFCDPDTTDNLDGSWDHEFASGRDDLPSIHSKSACRRCRRSSCMPASSSTRSRWSSPARARRPSPSAPSHRRDTVRHEPGRHADEPHIQPDQPVPGLDQARRLTGRNLTSGAVTYSNNLEKIETIRDDGLIEGADPTIAALTGRIDVRFAETTLIDLAADGTPVDLEFAYTLSSQARLVLTAHEVYLPKPKLAVEGPGACRPALTSTARRTRPLGACSP